MLNSKIKLLRSQLAARHALFLCGMMVFLAACSPRFDWREVHNLEGHFAILFPAKPVSHSKEIHLGEQKFKMSMQAADVEAIYFAVAYVDVQSAGLAPEVVASEQDKVLAAMKLGMLNNIHGQWQAQLPAFVPKQVVMARGQLENGRKLLLFARFIQHQDQVVQVVMLGEEARMKPEIVEMFFTSFQLK